MKPNKHQRALTDDMIQRWAYDTPHLELAIGREEGAKWARKILLEKNKKRKFHLRFRDWKLCHWQKPITIMYKGRGLYMRKEAYQLIPITYLFLGKLGGKVRFVGYTIFHNGAGINIMLPPALILQIAVEGRLGWWYKKGLIRIRSFNREFSY